MNEKIDLEKIPDDKKKIITLGFSIAVPIIRTFFKEIINKIPNKNSKNKCLSKLDKVLPEIEEGGYKITLNNKNYIMKYKIIKDLKEYNLNKEINKIPNLGHLSQDDKDNLIKEIDICASSIPSINNVFIKKGETVKFIKQIFDAFDTYNVNEENKDITIKIIDFQRVYYVYENGSHFGIHIDTC